MLTEMTFTPLPTFGRPRFRLARCNFACCAGVGLPNESMANSPSNSAVVSADSPAVIFVANLDRVLRVISACSGRTSCLAACSTFQSFHRNSIGAAQFSYITKYWPGQAAPSTGRVSYKVFIDDAAESPFPQDKGAALARSASAGFRPELVSHFPGPRVSWDGCNAPPSRAGGQRVRDCQPCSTPLHLRLPLSASTGPALPVARGWRS